MEHTEITIIPHEVDFSTEKSENEAEMNELLKAFAGVKVTKEQYESNLHTSGRSSLKTELTGAGTDAAYTGPLEAILHNRRTMKKLSQGTIDTLPADAQRSTPSLGRIAEIIVDEPSDISPYTSEQIDLTPEERKAFKTEVDSHLDMARQIIANPSILDSEKIKTKDVAGVLACICYLKVKSLLE